MCESVDYNPSITYDSFPSAALREYASSGAEIVSGEIDLDDLVLLEIVYDSIVVRLPQFPSLSRTHVSITVLPM